MEVYGVARSHVLLAARVIPTFRHLKMDRRRAVGPHLSREDKNREANLQFLEHLETAEIRVLQTVIRSHLESDSAFFSSPIIGGRRQVQTFPEIIPGPLFCILGVLA